MGHVYLVSKPSFSMDVVKVGKTTSLLSRMRSYGKDATWYRICMTEDCHTKEKELIKAFSKNFSLVEGNEYFRVSSATEALRLFDSIVSNGSGKKDDFMIPPSQEDPLPF
nr:GIY-YIG nuclease domain containing protein [Marseillevirus futianmevirus]